MADFDTMTEIVSSTFNNNNVTNPNDGAVSLLGGKF